MRKKVEKDYFKLYLIYSDKYDSTAKMIKKRYDAKPFKSKMTEKQFKLNFDVERLSEDVKKNRWSGKRIAEEMAKDDVYQATVKQARNYAKHVELDGKKMGYVEARARGAEVRQMIIAMDERLKLEGFNSYERSRIIGREIFKSD